MFLLKLLLKIVLLPVMLVLFILRLFVKVGMKVSSVVLGGLLLTVFICMVVTVIQKAWSSALIFAVIEAGLVLITAGAGMIEGLLQIAVEYLSRVICL